MTRGQIYWALCVPGVLLPYGAFVPWLMQHGLDLPLFAAELFSTRIGAFFGWDVIVSAVALLTFAGVEAKRGGPLAAFWLTAAAVFLVGVSLGLPLLLALRERRHKSGNDVGETGGLANRQP